MVLAVFAFAMMVTWAMGIAAQTHAAGTSAVLTYVQLGSVAIGSLIGQGACWIFEATAYRLDDTDPHIIRALHDLGWFTFLAPWPSFTIWCFAQAVAIFRDDRPEPGLPRWTGYLAVWTGLLFIPACLIFFFKTGPMAWNGAIAFYIPVFIFFIWVVGLTVPALQSVRRDGTRCRDPDRTGRSRWCAPATGRRVLRGCELTMGAAAIERAPREAGHHIGAFTPHGESRPAHAQFDTSTVRTRTLVGGQRPRELSRV